MLPGSPSQDRLHDEGLFEFAPVAIWEADASGLQAWFDSLRSAGVTSVRSLLEADPNQLLHALNLIRIVRANQASVALFQALSERHLLENISRILTTVPKPNLVNIFVARWENRLSYAAETRFLTLQGNEIFGLAGVSAPMEHGQPNLSRIIVTISDITGRKRAEEALRESEERLRSVMQASRTGSWEWSVNSRTMILDEQCRNLLGIPLGEEMTWELLREHVRPEDRPRVDAVLDAALVQSGNYEAECSVCWPDGSVHWLLLRGRSFHSRSGKPSRISGLATDITAQKHAEEVLRQREQWFRGLAETLPVMIFTRRPDGSCDYVNRRFYQYTGLAVGSAEGAGWLQALHPDDAERIQEAWRTSLATSQPFEAEYRMQAADGSYRWFLGRSYPILDSQGKILQWFGSSTDIDHVKHMEQELSDREALLRMAEEAGGVGSFELNLGTGRARVSPQLLSIYGEEPGTAETTRDAWAKRVHPDDWQRIGSCTVNTTRENPLWRCEYRILRSDGEMRWIEARCRTSFDPQGSPAMVVGVNVDITDRRRAEQSLRDSEEFYRTLIETLPVTVVLADSRGVINYICPAAKRMFGLEPGEGLGTTPTDWIASEHHELVRQRMHQVLVERQAQPPVEYRMLKRDGTPVWAQLASSPLLDSQGCLKGVITVCQDISDRKQAEEKLKEREELLRLVLEASATGWWHWDLATGHVTADTQAKALFGLPPDAEVSLDMFLRALAPEEVARVRGGLPNAISSGGDFDSEFHLALSDGSHHWILARGRAQRDQAGITQRAMGVIMDITERKRVEERLTLLNTSLEQLVAERTAIAERRTSQLRALASELAQAEQRERRRLAKILHDHLQQLLYAAKLKTSLLRRSTGDMRAAELAQQTTALLDESITASRSLAMELSPPVLYDRGLVGALEWLARQFAEKHNLTVGLELDVAADPRNEGIRVFLFEAIRELLLNVVKHAHSANAHVWLSPSGDENIRVVVSDTGQGFDASRMDRGSLPEGFGLLNIRERLELLGGDFAIDSLPGQGTRVTMHVARGHATTPAERAREAVAVASSVALGTGHAVAPTSPIQNEKVRVLIADDHRVVREGLITVIHDHPEIEVVGEASDGQQACELAERMRPDVILMDITMPGIDGIEATRRITRELPQVRVIGLSMHKREDMAVAMREAGASDYLSKEVAADALVAAVLAHSRKSR